MRNVQALWQACIPNPDSSKFLNWMEDSLLSKFVDKWKWVVIFLLMDKDGGVGGVGWTPYYEYIIN